MSIVGTMMYNIYLALCQWIKQRLVLGTLIPQLHERNCGKVKENDSSLRIITTETDYKYLHIYIISCLIFYIEWHAGYMQTASIRRYGMHPLPCTSISPSEGCGIILPLLLPGTWLSTVEASCTTTVLPWRPCSCTTTGSRGSLDRAEVLSAAQQVCPSGRGFPNYIRMKKMGHLCSIIFYGVICIPLHNIILKQRSTCVLTCHIR